MLFRERDDIFESGMISGERDDIFCFFFSVFYCLNVPGPSTSACGLSCDMRMSLGHGNCDTSLPCSQQPFSSFCASQASSPGNGGVDSGKVVPPPRPRVCLNAHGTWGQMQTYDVTFGSH